MSVSMACRANTAPKECASRADGSKPVHDGTQIFDLEIHGVPICSDVAGAVAAPIQQDNTVTGSKEPRHC